LLKYFTKKQKSNGMQRKVIRYLIFIMLLALPVRAENATDYFKLGHKSTITRTKIKYYSKALALDPNLVEAYEKRGLLYFFQREYDNVIKDFQTYIRLAPPKAEAYRMLGMGYLKIRDYRSAINIFTRAIEIEPNLSFPYANRAEAYRLNGNYQEAILDSDRAIKNWGEPIAVADAYKTRSKINWEIGRNREAYADHRKSVNLDPRIPRSWGRYPPVQYMRGMGLIVLIGVAFILIFGLKFKPPDKEK
jgi:tetratricopeptide (TPR) repeat protein